MVNYGYEIDLAAPLHNAYHGGVAFLYMEVNAVLKTIKKPTTYVEEVEKLESRGITVLDKEQAELTLSRLNYYNFKGSLHNFKEDDGGYCENVTFEKIIKIIEFDRKFKNTLLYALSSVEQILKTKIAYNFAHSFGPLDYLDSQVFISEAEHKIFIGNYQKSVKNNRELPFVAHHIRYYEGQLPIWVAIELFTVVMLQFFYMNLPTPNRKQIAKEFNTGPNQLASWIENIRYVRNLIAHYMRLYHFKMQKTPAKCKNNHQEDWLPSWKVFDTVQVMKFLINDKEEWNSYIIEDLKSIFYEYEEYIELDCIGFLDDWERILRI